MKECEALPRICVVSPLSKVRDAGPMGCSEDSTAYSYVVRTLPLS